ncbi:MAG: segregation/condensation protein A [Armatimonadota bacterium]|nr:segregation/condensation protein A [Armatimonadota bacterium]
MTSVQAGESPYKVVLGVYEGPLDLLLHLIREQKIDIYDIPIAKITEQYLAYLHLMEQLDLEIAGEWLVMAATLLEIKSRMLLPQDVVDEGDEEEKDDPRMELVERLIEYEKFKNAAEHFREREEERSKVFVRGNADLDFELKPMLSLEDITAADLLVALQRILADVGEEDITTVQRRKITVRMRMREIWQRLTEAGGRLTFHELFDQDATKLEVVITFLALLELMIAKRVCAQQDYVFGPITIIASDREHVGTEGQHGQQE